MGRDVDITSSSYYTPAASSTSIDGQTNLISSSAAGKAADVKNIINPTDSLTIEGYKLLLESSALSSGKSNAYVILPPTIDLNSPDALSALQTIASMNVKGSKSSVQEDSNDGPSTSIDRGDIVGDYEPVSTNYSIATNTINEKNDVKSATATDVDMVKEGKSSLALLNNGDLLTEDNSRPTSMLNEKQDGDMRRTSFTDVDIIQEDNCDFSPKEKLSYESNKLSKNNPLSSSDLAAKSNAMAEGTVLTDNNHAHVSNPLSTNILLAISNLLAASDGESLPTSDVLSKSKKTAKCTSSNKIADAKSSLSTTGDLLAAIYAVMSMQIKQSSEQRQIVNSDARAQRSNAMKSTKDSFNNKIVSAEKQKIADIKNAQSEIASGVAGIVGGTLGATFSGISLGCAAKAGGGGFKALLGSGAGEAPANAESLSNLSRMWSAVSQSVSTLANGIGSTISGSIKLGAADYGYESKIQSAMAELASAMMQTFISNMQADQSSYSTASQNIDATLSAMKQAAQMIYDQMIAINRNI